MRLSCLPLRDVFLDGGDEGPGLLEQVDDDGGQLQAGWARRREGQVVAVPQLLTEQGSGEVESPGRVGWGHTPSVL